MLDTPPVGLLSDAKLLSAMVDGVVLVVEAEKTSHAAVHAAIETIGRDRLFGVVLNRADPELGRKAYSSYRHDYGSAQISADGEMSG
jgi:Mrp family chromosome partitioning ATPase